MKNSISHQGGDVYLLEEEQRGKKRFGQAKRCRNARQLAKKQARKLKKLLVKACT